MDSLSAVRILLLLGLALGHTAATPLTTVTQIPRTDEDVLREAVTDGFLVDQHLLTTLTTQSTPTETTPLESATMERVTTESAVNNERATNEESALSEAEESAVNEDGAPSEEGATVQESSAADNSTSDDSNSGGVQKHSDSDDGSTVKPMPSSTTTPAPESEDKNTAEPGEDKTAERNTAAEGLFKNTSEDGSGYGSTTEQSISFLPTMFKDIEGSGTNEPPLDINPTIKNTTIQQVIKDVQQLDGVVAPNTETGTPALSMVQDPKSVGATEMPKGHVTPDWVIIVGFLVGVAALVLLCVAIATRDRWNSHSQFNQTGVTLQPANQQGVLEMQTFLHDQPQQPKENGKAEEYTVIPLDELPDTDAS